MNWNLATDSGAKFLNIGGACGQETWLYGVMDGAVYQPAVSGQHADFRKTEDGRYIAQPHEGGEGYYLIFYDFDPETGEFVSEESDSSAGKLETGKTENGHIHSYMETVTSAPTCGTSGTKTYTCSCGDTYTETIEPSGDHDWERKEELVSHEMGENKETTTVRWYSECRICGTTRSY